MFEILLLPNWARRSQQDQEDYGVDYEIELMTPEDKATGFIFKVQLKGTSDANYDKSGQLVFSDASVERFKYYINELRIPLVFVVCDVATKNCFWTKVQGNRQLESDLNDAAAKKQKTFTIKFPATRKLLKNEETSSQIVEAVESTLDTITLRGLQAISPASVRDHIGREPDIEATEKQFRLFAGLAATESIRKMVQAGDFGNAAKKAGGILESESESPSVRLLGGLSLVHTYNVELRRSGAPDATINAAKIKLGIASKMLPISRQKAYETRMKRFVRIYTRAARMNLNGQVALALAVSEQVQARQKETMAGPITHLHRLQVSALVSKDFFRLRDALYRLGAKGLFSVMPYALAEIAEGILPFVSALRILGRADLADAYVNALFDFLPFCVGVVRRFTGGSDVAEILHSLGMRFVGMAASSDKKSMPELLKRYEQALEGEPAFKCLGEVQSSLRKLVEEVQEDSRAQAKPSMAELRAYFAQQAAALGVNLSDPDDEIAQVVRIGLADLDPTRVLKNCQHIYVVTTWHGMPAEMLGLPTAGFKRIVCLRHGHSVEALSLDGAYATFSEVAPWAKDEICCQNCPDKVSHPEKWEWTEEWNIRQHAKYLDLVKHQESKSRDESSEV